MSNLLKKTIILIISMFILLFLTIFIILWIFSNDLPDYKYLKNYKPSVTSRVYAGNGELISEFSSKKRLFLPYESIPPVILKSFLSAEDKNFFKHSGIDAKGILRATLNNVDNIINSKRLEGASTITQQVAKNFLLSNEISLNRKFKEAILAFRIERALSKERIMELYLNEIYLGQGAYGVAAASLEYFDKPVSKLNYEEAALLAALPKAPSKYNPFKSLKLAKKRRDMVITNLYENNYIKKDVSENLKKKPINLKKRKIKLFEDSNYYSEEVRRNLIKKYGFDKIYNKGLNIKTPIDPNFQIKATKALRDGLELYDKRKGWRGALINKSNSKNWMNEEDIKKLVVEKSIEWSLAKVIKINNFDTDIELMSKKKGKILIDDINWTKKNFNSLFKSGDIIYVKKIKKNIWSLKQLPKVNGAVVVMDPFTGRVLSLVGGFSYKLSEFNRATQALRQPGSAFKPFVYALALENGYSPSTLVLDAPMVLEQGVGLKLWKPRNYGKKFYGPSTLRVGLEKSRNLMTVRIAQDLGLNKINKFSKKLNINKEPKELLSISLGSEETTLLNLTAAYCIFANGGKKIDPILIDRIQDSSGITIFNSDKRVCKNCDQISSISNETPKIEDNFKQVISPETAYQMVSLLEGVIQRGTGKRLKKLGLNLAGKTGTTNNNTDTWFLGFTSRLVVGVYVGLDEPKSLGNYETGARTAMPIFKKFIVETITKKDAVPFKVPKGITMMVINHKTGQKSNLISDKTIYESFKDNNLSELNQNYYYNNFIFKNFKNKQLKTFKFY